MLEHIGNVHSQRKVQKARRFGIEIERCFTILDRQLSSFGVIRLVPKYELAELQMIRFDLRRSGQC
jgi:hypothetical protein